MPANRIIIAIREGLASIDIYPQRVNRAGDTGVVVPYRLFAFPLKLVLGKIDIQVREFPEIVLYRFLILRGRRYDFGVLNESPGIHFISMI